METVIKKAKGFVEQKFKKAGRIPRHPFRVGLLLEDDFRVEDEEIIAAGFLHDILEDTSTTKSELKDNFNERIADIVSELTHPKDMTGLARTKFYRHLITISPEAKLIKIADLIDSLNLMISIYDGQKDGTYPDFKDNGKYLKFLKDFYASCSDGLPKNSLKIVIDKFESVLGS